MTYRLGVDVGGTFTDLFLLSQDTGVFWRKKTPSPSQWTVPPAVAAE
jgi:N-methylhydantoinase A